MVCPSCGKRLPVTVRYCAYCGAAITLRQRAEALGREALTPGQRSRLALGGLGALGGGLVGGLAGWALGDVVLGSLVGAFGVAASAMLSDLTAAPVYDRTAAQRFGQGYGALGGSLAALGGMLIALSLAFQSGAPHDWRAYVALVSGGLYIGLFCALAGGLIGAASGLLAGRLLAVAGRTVLQRRGVLIGAAMAWTLGSVLGGVFAGDFAARMSSTDRIEGAIQGMVMQVVIGVLVLSQVQRFVRRWRDWWGGRP
jgi:hypothetical protein